MIVDNTDYPSVAELSAALGLSAPTGLGMLPDNLSDATTSTEFLFSANCATVQALFRNEGVPCELLIARGERPKYVILQDISWYGPTLFVAASLFTENSAAVSIALGVISNYLTDYLKGFGRKPTIKLNVIVEKSTGGTCKKISYEGDVKGLSIIETAIRDCVRD